MLQPRQMLKGTCFALGKAAWGCRTPSRGRGSHTPACPARLWSAAPPCRFHAMALRYAACLAIIMSFAMRTGAATATITVDAAKPGPRLNPRMYGIFLEEINFGVDGGL